MRFFILFSYICFSKNKLLCIIFFKSTFRLGLFSTFLLVVVVVNSAIGLSSKKEFTAKDRKIALFGLIATHIQLVIGLVLYFVSPLGKESLSQMKDATLRLTAVEHPLVNIIAIALITIGWSKHKKVADNGAKFKAITVFMA